MDLSIDAPDWATVSLRDCLQPKTETVDPGGVQDLVYVGLEHIDPGSITICRWGDPNDVRSAKTLFTAGDLLYGKLRPYLDKAVLADRDGICSTDILVFGSRNGFDSDYLAFRLHAADFRRHAISTTSGVNHPRTSWPKLQTFEFACPSLEKQRAIAHALRTVQGAKDQTEQVIAAATGLRRSFLYTTFQQGAWETRLLGDVLAESDGSIQTGPFGSLLHAESYVSEGIPFIMPADMTSDGHVDLASVKRVSEEDHERLSRYQLAEGDVLVGRRGEIGRRALITVADVPSLCGSGSLRIRPGTSLEPRFLSALFELDEIRDHLKSQAVGSTMLNLNSKILESLPIALPPFQVQLDLANQLDAIAGKVSAEEQWRCGLDELFKGLLHQLMTGRTRLDEPETA